MNPALVSSILSTVAGPVTNMFSDMYRTNHEQTTQRMYNRECAVLTAMALGALSVAAYKAINKYQIIDIEHGGTHVKAQTGKEN